MKLDIKRDLGELYRAARTPTLIDVPELQYLTVEGTGDPNTSTAYVDAVEALFSVSYTLKFMLKRSPEAFDYSVMPLEGLWWMADGRDGFDAADKSGWAWLAMILQPDRITASLVDDAVAEVVRKRGALAAGNALSLERLHEGQCAQVTHVGPYADEGPTVAALHAFIHAQGLELTGRHHEIYLGDPRRSAPEKLRTIIRQPVAER
jgi:hypothetical protein